MKEFIQKNKLSIAVFSILVVISLLLSIFYKPSKNEDLFSSNNNFTWNVKETINFAKKKESNAIYVSKNISLPYNANTVQYSWNILNYKIKISNFAKSRYGEENKEPKLKEWEKKAFIATYYFKDRLKNIYFPADKIVFTGCKIKISKDNIIIDDLTQKLCKIVIFPKSDKEYQFYNRKWKVKFKKDDVIILQIKAVPVVYKLEQYINSYLSSTSKISPNYLYYLKTYTLVNIPTKFKINGKIKNVNLYKIIKSNNIDPKIEKEFNLKQEKGVDAKEVLKKYLQKSLYWRKVRQIKDFKVDYLSWNTEISFSWKNEWEYLITFVWKYDFFYSFSFKVKDKFDENDFKYEIYPESFLANFRSTFPFDKEKTEKNIKDFFKPYEVTFDWWSNRDFTINYYIPLKKTFSWNIVLENAVKTIKVPVKIYVDKMDPKYTYAWIEWKKVNVLPKNGYWGHHISIGYKNLKEFDLYFQTCTFNPNIKNNQTENMDLALMNCKWKVIHKLFKVKDFQYWKEFWIDYPLPKELENVPYFRVSFYKDFKWAKYFKKTNIWVTVKKAGKKYYVFANNFDDGNFTKQAVALFYKFDKWTFNFISKKILVDGETIFTWADNLALVQVAKWNDVTFSVLSNYARYRNEWNRFKINDYINSYDIGQRSYWWNLDTIKIYGYTDRWLYKAGDDVFFAGWVRNLKNKTSIPQWKVVVKLKHYGTEISKTEIESLDSFGGFKWKFTLPKSAELWVYQIQFIFSDKIRYSQDIKIEEYQKPTFLSKNKIISKNGEIFLEVNPQYYFGWNLKNYDLSVNWELKWKDICWYCWWRNEKDYYYNWVFKDSIYSGWDLNFENVKDKSVLKITNLNNFKNISYKITLKADIQIKDNQTDEKHFYTEYFTINPPVLVWLDGQPVERLYKEDVKDGKYTIKWNIKKAPLNVNNLQISYIVYKRDFGYTEEKWVDGAYYYVNNKKFTKIKTWIIPYNKNFKLNIPLDKAGEYFVRVFVKKDDKILWEVQKRIYYYKDNAWWYAWDQKNNFKLDVSISKKKYKLWENILVNINPYIKGSKVLLTVERWNDILDTYKFTLTWWKITIPVKDNYYPNINVSVVQFVGEKTESGLKNKKTSPDSFWT